MWCTQLCTQSSNVVQYYLAIIFRVNFRFGNYNELIRVIWYSGLVLKQNAIIRGLWALKDTVTVAAAVAVTLTAVEGIYYFMMASILTEFCCSSLVLIKIVGEKWRQTSSTAARPIIIVAIYSNQHKYRWASINVSLHKAGKIL